MFELLAHQKEGLDFLSENRRAFVADEPGTGKTAIVLRALASSERPSLVACKAALRENFRKEIELWVPGAKTQILMNPDEIDTTADFVVCGYKTLGDRSKDLAQRKFEGGIAFDESHYLKTEKAQRSVGALRVARTIPKDGFIIAASATPGVSRPSELLMQFKILGLLDQVANSDHHFLYRYCGPKKMKVYQKGKDEDGNQNFKMVTQFKGHSNLDELRNLMYDRGLVIRRRKKDVLELPEKHVVEDVLSTDSARWDEYREIETDFLRWLAKQKPLPEGYEPIAIERMTAMRKCAALSKLPIITAGAMEFMSETGKPLVVMAHHREVVLEMHERISRRGFRTGIIIGGQTNKKRFAQTEAFQNGELDIIVCSIEASAEGLTLTAAADLWLAELPYVPGRLIQAEDRCHRVGQDREVVVQHIVAKNSIDIRVSQALKAKQQVLNQLFDGEAPLEDDEHKGETSVFHDVMQSYLSG